MCDEHDTRVTQPAHIPLWLHPNIVPKDEQAD
jgi:hypothetical protein